MPLELGELRPCRTVELEQHGAHLLSGRTQGPANARCGIEPQVRLARELVELGRDEQLCGLELRYSRRLRWQQQRNPWSIEPTRTPDLVDIVQVDTSDRRLARSSERCRGQLL